MALLFIHGVNNRDGPIYRQGVAARDEMIRRLVLASLKKGRYSEMQIHNVYWGDLGAEFAWDLASIPQMTEQGGPGESAPIADDELIQALGKTSSQTPTGVGPTGVIGTHLLDAARRDPVRVARAVLAPIVQGELPLEEQPDTDEAAGRRAAMLLMAADRILNDSTLPQKLAVATTDDEAFEVLRDALEAQFEIIAKLLEAAPQPLPAGIRPQGALWNAFQERVSDLFERAKGAAGRAASDAALRRYRLSVHERFARFFGDVFIYINTRNCDNEQSIRVRVQKAVVIAAAESNKAGDPFIVMTHSMGGNIFYDLITHFAPDTPVDAWISVGGQVAQFEEMKIFVASDRAVRSPQKVGGVVPPVKSWLNVYDPVDPFAFRAAPVFSAIKPKDDVLFDTGGAVLDAHGAYFLRPSFYDLVNGWLEEVLS